jgi:hypothetical protein
VNLNGLHVVTIAWSDAAAGSIIDFSFVPFATEGRPAAACEKLVLDGLQTWWDGIRTHPWGQLDDREGTGWVPDLTLIDSGWKDKQWGTEPVYILAAQAGFRGILPCKGRSPWQQRNASQTVVPLPECNLSYANGIWLADLDADAWKLKVHHGFLQPFGTVGSLALFTPPRDEAGREKWQRHQNYAGHILSEEWQKQPNSSYRWVPEGSRPGHLRSQKANHYLDATAYAIAARTIWGLWTIRPKQGPPGKPARKPPSRDRDTPFGSSWIQTR